MRTTLLTLTLIAAAGVAHAQTTPPTQPGTPGGTSSPSTGLPTTTPNATAAEAAAKASLEAKGYTGVEMLTRDSAGNWTGKAMKDNVEIAVTLDTLGNVREQ